MSENLKRGLAELRDKLAELETQARRLQNQNFADIVASAKGRVSQLCDHPDLELVQKETDGERDEAERKKDELAQQQGLPLNDPNAQDGNPNRDPNAAPFSPPGAKAEGDAKTYVPGDPRFDRSNNNPDFRQPDNVALNPDGTLRQAPNVAGAHPDVRKEA